MIISPLTGYAYGQPLAQQRLTMPASAISSVPNIVIPGSSRGGDGEGIGAGEKTTGWTPVRMTRGGADLAPKGVQKFGFDDFLDIVNPLHHLPVVGEIYRRITGDDIKPAAKVMGAGLYGGVLGVVGAVASATYAQANGKDASQTVQTASAENGDIKDADLDTDLDTDLSAAPHAQTSPSAQVSSHAQTSPNAQAAPMRINDAMDAALQKLAGQTTASPHQLPGVVPIDGDIHSGTDLDLGPSDVMHEMASDTALANTTATTANATTAATTATVSASVNTTAQAAGLDARALSGLARYRANSVAANTTMPHVSNFNLVR